MSILEAQACYEMSPNRYLLIDKISIRRMQKYCQLTPNSVESGGLLYGFERTPHLQITGITTPHPQDNQSRFRWERCDAAHLSEVTSVQVKIGACYLGEWHTHPEDYPRPSNLDINEWEKIAKKFPSYVYAFIIVGRLGISVYTFVFGKLHRATHIKD